MSIFHRDENYIVNKQPNVIYINDFSDNAGKYISMVSENSSVDVRISPKVQFRLTFIREGNKLKGLEIIKLRKKNGWIETSEKINLSTFEFSDLISFVELLKTVDPSSFSSGKLKIYDGAFSDIDDNTLNELSILMKTPKGAELAKALVQSNEITPGDIINIAYRKEQLMVFEKLLKDSNFIKEYVNKEKITDDKEEKVWQYFFKKNEWIFGLGLDYQYLETLETEVITGKPDSSGRGTGKVDTLARYNNFTVLIEIKSPSTPLFGKRTDRARSWRLSDKLQSAVSQILEYKSAHLEEWNSSSNFDHDGSPLDYYAYDSKSILLIGRDSQLIGDSRDDVVKRRTFELYRRDSRNIEIMTYDELFNRASHIVSKNLEKNER